MNKPISRCILLLFLLCVCLRIEAKEKADVITKAYHESVQYEYIQKYKKAIHVLTPIYQEYPNGYLVNLRLGWLYYLAGLYSNSTQHYSNALRVLPGAVEPKLGLALTYLTQQQYDQVVQMSGKILQKDYYNYYANLYLAKALRRNQQPAEAEKVALKMLGLYPMDNTFLNELGLAYLAEDEPAKAQKCFTTVLLTDPVNLVAKANVTTQ